MRLIAATKITTTPKIISVFIFCLTHILYINADKFVEVDDELIPTGNLLDVTNTPMDFRTAKEIGLEINSNFEQLSISARNNIENIRKNGRKPLKRDF